MRHIVATILLAVLMSCGIESQASVFTWSKHNLTFEVPDNGMVTYNSNTRFEVSWEDMVMTIQLFAKDKDKKKDVYKTTLESLAMGYNMYDTKHGKIKVKGFDGYTLEGIMPDGSRCVLANLVSKQSDLVVQISINYYYGNREEVDNIIKSFAENDQKQPNREKRKQKVQSKDDAEKQAQKLQEEQRKREEELRKQREERERELRRRTEKIYEI